MNLVARLREVPLFAGLPDDDLERLCRGSEEVELATGEVLFAEGDEGDRAFVVLDGEIEVVKAAPGGEVLLAVQTDGVVGEMALLEGAPRNASVRARSDTRLLAISRVGLEELLDSSPSASRAFFRVVVGRLRDTQASLRHIERMAQIGTLTAGLAHELNNPAAAVSRSADQLRQAMIRHVDARVAVAESIDEANTATVERIVAAVHERRGVGASLSTVERSDLEDRIERWMDGHRVERSWALAPGLVDAGITERTLADLAEGLSAEMLGRVLELVDATHDQLSMLHRIEDGSRRMSHLVRALKSYAHLDRAPVQAIDVTTGLEDTLLLLSHASRDVAIEREYAGDLGTIEAFGAELNQVWTNLIDNAFYAMRDTPDPRLTLRTTRITDGIAVEVEDNGPGIPDDVRHRVFDAFFTTKPPGSGTGLGLDVSQNIVVHRHGGRITVDSRPGRTVFRVELPVRLPPLQR